MAKYLFQWETGSMIFYVILGLIASYTLYCSKKYTKYNSKWLFNDKYLTIWFCIWVIVATYRLIDFPIGGTDATNYVTFFQICLNNYWPEFFDHFAGDLLFKYFNQIIRLISSDYHLYFFVTYSLMCYAFISFYNEFTPNKTNFTPYVLTFFLFLRGFSSIRSHLSIVVIIFACILLLRQKYKSALFVAFLSAFIHKAALLYAMFIPFYLIFHKRGISLKLTLLLIFASSFLASIFQELFIVYTSDMELSGVYNSYASKSIGTSFLDNAWKIAFEQMLLGLFMLVNHKKLKQYISVLSETGKRKVNIIYMLCIFDLLLIPVNFTLNIWRGYEYFYLARIVMWGILLYIHTMKFSPKLQRGFSFIFLLCFISWMIFRVWSTWETSGLMPYIFEPFLYI